MLYFLNSNTGRTTLPFNTGLLESAGCGMVLTSPSMSSDSFYIRMSHFTPHFKKIRVSIVICTLDRPESLNETLTSLTFQTFKEFEVILVTERGDLSVCRQKGLYYALGDIVCFIDDDVYCPPTWLQSITQSFREGVVGVSGPTTITKTYEANRDCFKYKRLRKIQEWVFNVPSLPGRLSPCGAPSMASNNEDCYYEGEVEYLECCNMSVRRKEAIDAGGFKALYYRTSEWCEVDLALRLNQKGLLYFTPSARLYHRPSKAGVYRARLNTRHRWDNFVSFQKLWIRPSLRRHLYWAFVWTYLKMKDLRMI